MTEQLLKMLAAILGEYLINPKSAAKYAKYVLRIRDYSNILFPLDKYPEGDYSGTMIKDKALYAVPPSAVTDLNITKKS
jgi:hypothetical protein